MQMDQWFCGLKLFSHLLDCKTMAQGRTLCQRNHLEAVKWTDMQWIEPENKTGNS
jgi:hypothetical protein